MTRRAFFNVVFAAAIALTGCATLPPGADYPKKESTALRDARQTKLGQRLEPMLRAHRGASGFHLLMNGTDSFLARAELSEAAQKTLDIQYYIIENDDTGKLLMDEVLRAADRGVRVRLLVDDASEETPAQDLATLAAHDHVEIRLFNPFLTRGVFSLLRFTEYALEAPRVNSRMHNKLFVADNSVAIIGGRNVGDEYFQASDRTNFGDLDVLAVGPAVRDLSRSFDTYWNSKLAIPIEALLPSKPTAANLQSYRATLSENRTRLSDSAFVKRMRARDPLAGMLTGKRTLVWAPAQVLYDAPEKNNVEKGKEDGPLLRRWIGSAMREAKSEVIIASPYLVPGDGGMRLLESLRQRNVRISVLTNSLASTDVPMVHAAYQHYRERMVKDGIELYEARPMSGQPGNAGDKSGGSGDTSEGKSAGQFTLHDKIFIFDRKRAFIGSMNFDRRSLRINTEGGLLIDSPELARQLVDRFDAITSPAKSYHVVLGPADAFGRQPLVWRTEESGRIVDENAEPKGDLTRAIKAELLTLLPLDDLL